MSKDNQAIKISVEPNLDIGNKDQDKINGQKGKSFKNTEIHNVVNNFNSSPLGLETLLTSFENRIQNLEKQLSKFNKNIKLNSVPPDTLDLEYDSLLYPIFIKSLNEKGINFQVITDINLLNKYKRSIIGLNNKKVERRPTCIIRLKQTDYEEFKQQEQEFNEWLSDMITEYGPEELWP